MPTITPYCTLAQLYSLGMRAEALASFDDPAKLAAIDAATTQVTSYLGGYTMPLQTVGLDLTRATAIIASYDLLSVKGFNPDENASDKNVRQRYEDVTSWLRDVAKQIVIPAGIVDSGTNPVGGEAADSPRVISSESRGYSVRGTQYANNPDPFQGR